VWNAILSLPDEKAKIQLGSLKVAISGGAPLSPLIHERFAELTGRRMLEAYGLSEASSATHMAPYPDGAPTGSIGLPLPDTQARIMDIETGLKECEVGEVGELAVKGPQMMRGYWNNEALTAVVLRDGWFYTRDLARMDQDGFFYIVDRKDDLIISNGFNIYPGQVEDILESHPQVKDAAVIGIPDRRKGQALVAVIALKEGAQAEKEELMNYCNNNMPDYRVPKTIIFRDAIPRDPAGKLLRRILKQEIKDD
jgi:long-chain acyl-CoA synthetase